MKVSDRSDGLGPLLQGIGEKVEASRPGGSSVPLAAAQDDEVRVSQVARALARLIAVSSPLGSDPIRVERVEPLRTAVARGEYRVDLEATARSFLREVASDLAR